MDESLKTAITRFGPNLRIAGTTELGDRRTTLREQPLQTLIKVIDDWFRTRRRPRPRSSGSAAAR
jgi:D-amino-acid dehydrogenase